MNINYSKSVLVLYFSVLVLLPFSRLAELPILLLSIIGLMASFTQWKSLIKDQRFRALSTLYLCYLGLILFSSFDSYWQEKTLTVALASLRFYLATIALIYYLCPNDFKRLIQLIGYLVVFWAFDALFQYFVGFDLLGRASDELRLNGIFGKYHIKLGPVLALFLPIVLVALRKQSPILRWLAVIAVVIVILLSGTRSAWIMMAFVLFAYWLHHVKQRRFQLLFKASVIALALIVGLWFVSDDFQQRVDRSLSAFKGSNAELDYALANRLSIWKSAIAMFEKHPINGVGAHAYRIAYPVFAEDNDIWQQNNGVGMHAHHWILEILSDTGLIGLLLMSVAIYVLIGFFREIKRQNYSWAFFVSITAAFLPLVSTYSLFASFWSICIWFCGAGFIVMNTTDE